MNYLEKSFLYLTPQGYQNVVYSEFGAENHKIIICVHGLTGNGRDFDYLAPALADEGYRVIAIDMPGRGRSDFCADPSLYCYKEYLHVLNTLMAKTGVTPETKIDWIGTSMGGLLGFRLAGVPNSPIKRMILNDVGPFVPQEALDFIAGYVSRDYEFESVEQLRDFMKQMRGPAYGPVTEEQWLHMAKSNMRQLESGKITYGYDPQISFMFGKEPVGETVDLWPYWEAMNCPALILRGENSTIFPPNVAERMMASGPGHIKETRLEELEGCGHVPSLMADYQIEMITSWLKETD